MKQFISFVIKEAKHIIRDKRTMLILFGMPVVMMLLFGFAITTDVKNVRAVIVMSNADHVTQQAVNHLAQHLPRQNRLSATRRQTWLSSLHRTMQAGGQDFSSL